MFIPTWIIITICVLFVLKLIIKFKFHNYIKNKFKNKFEECTESFDIIFKLKNLKIHGYLDENKKFTFEKVN